MGCTTNDRKSLIENAVRGASTGLRAGAIFCGISIALNALLKNAVYTHFGLSAAHVVVLYLAGGAIIGLIVGALRSLVTGPVSASLVAATALMPAIAIARVSLYGVRNWRWTEVIGLLIVSLFLGALWGPFFWRAREHEKKI
jgi:hypothetical protein